MKNLKKILSFVVMVAAFFCMSLDNSLFGMEDKHYIPLDEYDEQFDEKSTTGGVFHVTKQMEEDTKLREKMRDLFFDHDQEEDGTKEQRKAVCKKAVKKYGAKKLTLVTEDSKKISTLYFKRSNPRVNIIYLDGYYPDGKEWCVPFAILHPKDNILTFDYREFGESEGKSGRHILGVEAYYLDIQAAIDFIRKDNDKPVILHGICFGAAIAMYATLKAHKEGKSTADALGFNSIWKTFDVIFNNGMKNLASPAIVPFLFRLDCCGIFKKILNLRTKGSSLFSTLKPIDMIEDINLPCWFDHFTLDTSAPLDDAIELYKKAKGTKVFFQSDFGKHALVHSSVPFQYRKAYDRFLREAKLIDED